MPMKDLIQYPILAVLAALIWYIVTQQTKALRDLSDSVSKLGVFASLQYEAIRQAVGAVDAPDAERIATTVERVFGGGQ